MYNIFLVMINYFLNKPFVCRVLIENKSSTLQILGMEFIFPFLFYFFVLKFLFYYIFYIDCFRIEKIICISK